MSIGFRYDDSNLWSLLATLDEKGRRRVLRNAVRMAARQLHAAAVRRMLSSGFGAGGQSDKAKAMRRSVRGLVRSMKKEGIRVRHNLPPADARHLIGVVAPLRYGPLGLRVTVKPAKARMHLNRRGQLKPVAFWAETGTGIRSARSLGATRGAMPAYHFMRDTRNQDLPQVQKDFQEHCVAAIVKESRKYGCK